MRLIDADALKEDYRMADDCKDCKTNVRDCEYDRVYTKMDFCGWLDDAPTVDAIPVRHGHWIGGEIGKCSVCGHEGCSSDIWNDGDMMFCPNCGAQVDGKENGNG